MKATLHDVAARADVSIATVSRVVNGLSVSKDTLARVQKAVIELGYVANEAARALKSDKTLTIGVIFYDLRNTLGIELLDALSESVEEAGYSLVISTARGNAGRYDLLMRRFLERRVDALFLLRPPNASDSIALYHAANIPVIVLFDSGGAFADLPLVRPVFSDGAKALAEHLQQLGHKRLAIIKTESRSPAIAAIVEAQRAQGGQIDMIDASEADSSADMLAKRGKASVIVATDPQVRGLLAACRATGVRVPDDLSIISVSDFSAESYHRKHAISSLLIDPRRIGRAAGSSILAWLSGSRPAQRIRVQHAIFTPRGTTGPALHTAKN